MIGRMRIDPPEFSDGTRMQVESQRLNLGQDYHTILLFGLWGTPHYSPETRLYAGYRHAQAHPDSGPAWLEVARVHLELDQYAAAEAILNELLRLDDMDLYPGIFREDPHIHMVLLNAAADHLDEAMALLDAQVEHYGTYPIFLYIRASLLHGLARWDEAVATYDQALAALDGLSADEIGDDLDVPAARTYIDAQKTRAQQSQPFTGQRPLDLTTLYDA